MAIAFEELDEEDSPTTVFRALIDVSTFFHDQTTQRQSIWETLAKIILLWHALYILQAGSVRVFQSLRREREAVTVSQYSGPGCLTS